MTNQRNEHPHYRRQPRHRRGRLCAAQVHRPPRRRPFEQGQRRPDRRRPADPRAPRDIWDSALDELDGQIDVLVNNAGIYEAVADNAPDEEWHAAWARTMTINLQSAADLSKLAVSHFLDLGIRRRIVNVASRAAFRGDLPAALALCRVQGGYGGHDPDHRSRLRGRRHIVLRGRARVHRVGNDRRLSRRAAAARKSSPTSPSGGWQRTDEIAEVIRWLAIDAPASATGCVIDANGASYVR